MPVYGYRCPNGHEFEAIHSMRDTPLTACKVCGAAPVARVFSPSAASTSRQRRAAGQGSRRQLPTTAPAEQTRMKAKSLKNVRVQALEAVRRVSRSSYTFEGEIEEFSVRLSDVAADKWRDVCTAAVDDGVYAVTLMRLGKKTPSVSEPVRAWDREQREAQREQERAHKVLALTLSVHAGVPLPVAHELRGLPA